MNLSEELVSILTSIRDAQGWPLIVGGAVRDHLLNQSPKDFDVEVYRLSVTELLQILNKFGKTDQVGISFGIIKLHSHQGNEYDFSLPRRENKQGSGHRGFIVNPDPSMTPEEACSRRDYTINAMAYDFSKNQIIDYFEGQKDLQAGILRHAGPAFAEDPLRVLRGLQFASRFQMQVAPETAILCQQLKSEYQTLAKERIWGEWQKWALKSIKPSAGLRFLRETGWLSCYPALERTIGIQQHTHWHPEGDVWEHTCHVADAAAQIAIRDGLSEENRCLSVLAALCHDLGKPETTILEDGIWRSPGHAEAGVPHTEVFLEHIDAPLKLREKCAPLVKEHLAYLQATSSRNVRRLATRLGPATIEELLWLIEADHSGRPPLPPGLPEEAKQMSTKATQTNALQGRQLPILMGKHLLERGLLQPGPSTGITWMIFCGEKLIQVRQAKKRSLQTQA